MNTPDPQPSGSNNTTVPATGPDAFNFADGTPGAAPDVSPLAPAAVVDEDRPRTRVVVHEFGGMLVPNDEGPDSNSSLKAEEEDIVM